MGISDDPLRELLAATDRDALAEFVQAAIGGLAAVDEYRRRQLLDTYSVVRAAESLKAAAVQLGLSPRHVRNRLRRLETLVDLDLRSPVDRALLDLACEAIPLLRRP